MKKKTPVKKNKNLEIGISFDLEKIGPNAMEKLFEIERLFGELGIYFDTGTDFHSRDWEWDYSLEGPIRIWIK